mgnify:FL=1
MDWRFDRRDGTYKIVDFNPRVGAQFNMFDTEAGIDVVRALHLDLTGRAVPAAANRVGRALRVEHLDLPARMAYRGGTGHVPPAALIGTKPERAWFQRSDPLPGVIMAVRSVRPALQRVLRARHRRTATPAVVSVAVAPTPVVSDVV